MYIVDVSDERILFNNGNTITFDHERDCCEDNYADFSTLTEHNIHYHDKFKTNLKFKFVDGLGFMFGDEGQWIFIPCYSEQNGYYTSNIDIYYNNKLVCSGNALENIS